MKDLVKFNAPRGILLILIGLIVIYYINANYLSKTLDENKAKMPKVHLMLVESAIAKHDLEKSYTEVNLAIESMNAIEYYADSVATHYIEKSIYELENLKSEILRDSIYLEDFNHAFYETFNAMAYANLRLSELELKDGNKLSAQRFLKTSFSYLKKSLKYTEAINLEKEEKVIGKMREILKLLKYEQDINGIDFVQINDEMEDLMNN